MRGRGAMVATLAGVLALGAVSGCRREAKGPTLGEQEDAAKDRWAIDSARMEADRVAAASPISLPGTNWQLVQFRSGDDKVQTPEEAAIYSVEFGTDGRVSVVAGCNRGTGTWTETPPSGLTFGPLATTRAMCPPGSMSARFLRDFEHMRSYVIVGGHLYVSLMADGGIYEFAPDEFVVEKTPSGDAGVEPVVFLCTDSTGARSRIAATFLAGKPAKVTLKRRGKSVTVPQVRSASGARYEGPGVVFWNKGRDATATWLGTTFNCALTIE